MSAPANLQTFAGLTMLMAPGDARAELQKLRAFIDEAMVEGVDYGPMPGVKAKPPRADGKKEAPKMVLFKSGAEMLAELYNLAATFEYLHTVRDYDRGFYYFEVKTILVHRATGVVVGEGLGSCNSKEGRYGLRWVADWKLRSEGVDLASLQGVETREASNARGKYTEYLVPNEDIHTLANTILKMAVKRSLVDAVIRATRSSGILTQDLEDMAPEVVPLVDDAPSWEPRASETKPAGNGAQRPAAPPSPASAAASKPTSELQALYLAMTEREQMAADIYGPRFPRIMTRTELRPLREDSANAVGRSASDAYRAWHAMLVAQTEARLGAPAAPGPARAAAPPPQPAAAAGARGGRR